MVSLAVFHRERFRECLSIAGIEPFFVVAYFSMITGLGVKEISEDIDFQIGGKTIEIALCRVLDPLSFPVVIAFNIYRIEFIVYACRKQFLDSFVFCLLSSVVADG